MNIIRSDVLRDEVGVWTTMCRVIDITLVVGRGKGKDEGGGFR